MANIFQEFGIYVAAATPLARPNHGFSSITQLARRARAQEDKLRRVLARLGAELSDPLITTSGRRLTLTDVGRDLLTQASQLLALAKGRIEDTPSLVLRVGVEAGIDFLLVAETAGLWLREWQGLASLQIRPLPSDLVQEQLSSGLLDVGLGWTHAFTVEADETLKPAVPLRALLAASHELAATAVPLTAAEISGQVLISGNAEEQAAEHIAHVPQAMRAVVEAGHLPHLVRHGDIGLGFTLSQPDGLVLREIQGADPASLGLYFPPGRAEARPEHVTFFADAVMQCLDKLLTPSEALTAETTV